MGYPLLLGLDIGTSGVKAVLLAPNAADGRYVAAEAVSGYSTASPRPGWSEQDPADWWTAVSAATRLTLELSAADVGDVAAVALSGQMHGATLVGRGGQVLRPCILWNDQRSGGECDWITERIGLESLTRWVANPALAGFTAPKLLWVRRHEPEIYAATESVLLPKDYVNYCLTGVRATEVSDASGTLLFDVASRTWSREMLEALEIPRALLPDVYESTVPIGAVHAEAARATGLKEGTPVVAGGADNACAAVGMGVVSSGQVLVSLGTSGTIVAPGDAPRVDPGARLHTFCHAAPHTWYLMGVVLSAGGSLRWFRDVVVPDLAREAEAAGLDAYDAISTLAAEAPPGCEGLLFLPYLTGERTPHGDPYARGVYFGLSPRHTRAHLARSVMEGTAHALADSAAIMRSLGLEMDNVRATGGGARSPLWRQILADVLGVNVHTGQADTGPAFGAALLAGVGAGLFPSLPEATARMVSMDNTTNPDANRHKLYGSYQSLYDSLYLRLRDRFAESARLAGGQKP